MDTVPVWTYNGSCSRWLRERREAGHCRTWGQELSIMTLTRDFLLSILSRTWGLRWMNPPYGRTIGQWVRTAWAHRHHGATVCLLPARTDTKWWHDNIPQASQVVFIKGRLKFGDATNSAPFPSAFVVFGELSELQYAKLSEYGISYDKQNKVANIWRQSVFVIG